MSRGQIFEFIKYLARFLVSDVLILVPKSQTTKWCIKENKSVFLGGPVGGGGRSRSPRTSRRLCNWCQKKLSYPLAVDKYSPISHEFGRKLASRPDWPFPTDGTTGTTHPL